VRPGAEHGQPTGCREIRETDQRYHGRKGKVGPGFVS
jgi:hypothetical protein